MKLGILGGTFDPIHLGHLIIAEEVRVKLALSRLMFVPAGQPWLKSDRPITANGHRLAMVKLAIQSNPSFECSTAELERAGPTYTVDTIAALRNELDAEIYFIVGPDALTAFHRWKGPERLISLCYIVEVSRPGKESVDISRLEAVVPGVSRSIKFVDTPQIGISSTAIRERVRAGMSIRYLVPPDVEKYINEYKLYQA